MASMALYAEHARGHTFVGRTSCQLQTKKSHSHCWQPALHAHQVWLVLLCCCLVYGIALSITQHAVCLLYVNVVTRDAQVPVPAYHLLSH